MYTNPVLICILVFYLICRRLFQADFDGFHLVLRFGLNTKTEQLWHSGSRNTQGLSRFYPDIFLGLLARKTHIPLPRLSQDGYIRAAAPQDGYIRAAAPFVERHAESAIDTYNRYHLVFTLLAVIVHRLQLPNSIFTEPSAEILMRMVLIYRS